MVEKEENAKSEEFALILKASPVVKAEYGFQRASADDIGGIDASCSCEAHCEDLA